MIPPTQIAPQPHITESTANETTTNYPNQEQTTTKTQGFKHLSMPMIEPPSESPSTPLVTPLHSNSTTSTPLNNKPSNWNQMSAKAKRNWTSKHKEHKDGGR
jgi:hypothetical protein